MKLKQAIILIVLVLTSIVILKSCDYRLWMLKCRELTYYELPDSVKSVLYVAAFKDPAYLTIDHDTIISDDLLLANLADTSVYYLKSFNLMIAPWIYYRKLIDKKKILYIDFLSEHPILLLFLKKDFTFRQKVLLGKKKSIKQCTLNMN